MLDLRMAVLGGMWLDASDCSRAPGASASRSCSASQMGLVTQECSVCLISLTCTLARVLFGMLYLQ